MIKPLKPLRECVRTFRDRVARDYETATTDSLFELIVKCDTKLLTEREDCKSVDQIRAISWFANAELTRRGISPRSRKCLGPIPIRSTRLLHDIRKQDAPYLDLQWLAYRYPGQIPKRWSGVKKINATASGEKPRASRPPIVDDEIVFAEVDRDEVLDAAFDDADRLIERKISTSKLCMALKLGPAAQSEMRWLCSRKVHQLLGELDKQGSILRDTMRSQGIKQLTPDRIEARLQMIRAWKLAGGGTKWQAAADVYGAMTGNRISRQGMKDMITRLGSQKLIRRRRGKSKKIEPILLE